MSAVRVSFCNRAPSGEYSLNSSGSDSDISTRTSTLPSVVGFGETAWRAKPSLAIVDTFSVRVVEQPSALVSSRMCGVGRHIAITRLGIVRVFGLLPLNGRTRDISLVIELRSLHPTFGHRVVAQFSDDGVVAITRVVGVGRCTLHRGHSRWRAQLAVVVLALFLYLHHAGGIVFLACRNVVAADAVNVAELAWTDFT